MLPYRFLVGALGGLLGLVGLAAEVAGFEQAGPESPPPNIVYILADDLGYGDLSCYGQQLFETPNIDRLARQGMLFTQHYAGATVCSPSRSALMTGEHTGHTPKRGNFRTEEGLEGAMPPGTVTLAHRLRRAGYATGAFGKWGLGEVGTAGGPLQFGFDTYFGYIDQTLAHNYYPYSLHTGREEVVLEGNADGGTGQYAPELIQRETLKFIEDHQDGPFFCFVPSVLPHAELVAPEAYMERYRGKFLPEKVYQGVDEGPRYRRGPYGSQPESHAAFAAMIAVLDDHVGQILDKLEELGIADNTLVIFSSDNGPHKEGGADPDYFDSNGPLRGYKRDLTEGGIRVPMLARWPGKIEPGSRSDHVSAFWDVLPTFADIIGMDRPHGIDGLSFLPTLLGKGEQPQHGYLYWEFHEQGGKVAIRKGKWKGIRLNMNSEQPEALQLYDLSLDIGESTDLAKLYPEVVAELEALLAEARTVSPVERFNFGPRE